MSVFEYVAVMVGVVLALAVSHVLNFIANVISNPERVKGYWLHFLWTALILAMNLHAWLLLWTFHGQTDFSVSQLAMMLFLAALTFIVARVLVPELQPDRRLDLRDHFHQIRVPFFTTLSLCWLSPVLGSFVLEGRGFFEPLVLARAFLLGLSVSGMLIKNLTWHAILSLLCGIPIFVSLALLRPTLE